MILWPVAASTSAVSFFSSAIHAARGSSSSASIRLYPTTVEDV